MINNKHISFGSFEVAVKIAGENVQIQPKVTDQSTSEVFFKKSSNNSYQIYVAIQNDPIISYLNRYFSGRNYIDEDSFRGELEHRIFLFRAKPLEKDLRQQIKGYIKELDARCLELYGRRSLVTNHRRRGRGDDQTRDLNGNKVRGDAVRFELFLRRPIAFAGGQQRNHEVGLDLQGKKYFSVFIHGWPLNIFDFSQGWVEDEDRFFVRFVSSPALSHEIKNGMLRYSFKYLYQLTEFQVQQFGQYSDFLQNILEKLDELLGQQI